MAETDEARLLAQIRKRLEDGYPSSRLGHTNMSGAFADIAFLLSRPSAQEREAIIEECATVFDDLASECRRLPGYRKKGLLYADAALRIRALKTDTPDR